jgi:hypothetical protein
MITKIRKQLKIRTEAGKQNINLRRAALGEPHLS